MSCILSINTSGGEQVQMAVIAEMIPVIIYVTLALAIITIPFFKTWIKKRWWVNATVIIFCSAITGADIYERNLIRYDSDSETITMNGKEYVKTTEYYDHEIVHEKIRSISFTLNDKKDSIWTTYAEDGKIIQQEIYKNGTLIKKIK